MMDFLNHDQEILPSQCFRLDKFVFLNLFFHSFIWTFIIFSLCRVDAILAQTQC